jgi:hypothetical protein
LFGHVDDIINEVKPKKKGSKKWQIKSKTCWMIL